MHAPHGVWNRCLCRLPAMRCSPTPPLLKLARSTPAQVDAIVTTGGGVEEDFMKCLTPHYIGDFSLKGTTLRRKVHCVLLCCASVVAGLVAWRVACGEAHLFTLLAWIDGMFADSRLQHVPVRRASTASATCWCPTTTTASSRTSSRPS